VREVSLPLPSASPYHRAARLTFDGAALVGLALTPTAIETPNGEGGDVVAQALIEAFFRGTPPPDGVLLAPVGTPFQRHVWSALREIPHGQTRSYGDLARQLTSSPRAVAGACRANPIALLIPCHRVVAQKGLGGYAGATQGPELEFKAWLLRHERAL